mgnify:CR=1 FL=1
MDVRLTISRLISRFHDKNYNLEISLSTVNPKYNFKQIMPQSLAKCNFFFNFFFLETLDELSTHIWNEKNPKWNIFSTSWKINFICSSQRVTFFYYKDMSVSKKKKIDKNDLQNCLYFVGKTKEWCQWYLH